MDVGGYAGRVQVEGIRDASTPEREVSWEVQREAQPEARQVIQPEVRQEAQQEVSPMPNHSPPKDGSKGKDCHDRLRTGGRNMHG